MGDTNGNSLYDDGEPYDPLLTGYAAPADVGLSLALRAASPVDLAGPPRYWVIALPPIGHATPPQTGETWLRTWVSQCAPYGVSSGDSLLIEPGRLHSALLEELDALIATDPGAYWDDATKTVQGSAFARTPRLLAVSCWDPSDPPSSDQQYVVVTKIAVVFLESTSDPSTIHVRFVDHASETVATEPTTWGRIKSMFGKQD